LAPQQTEPLLARALSYIAINDAKAAVSDLDEAVQLDQQNAQTWVARGLAYERLGEKDRAAGSYAKAIQINREFPGAIEGFDRVGGQYGKQYQAY
jgi:Tfp pilus assembly protein PilF